MQIHLANEILFITINREGHDFEFKSTLSKGAVVSSDHEPGQFISTIFVFAEANEKFD